MTASEQANAQVIFSASFDKYKSNISLPPSGSSKQKHWNSVHFVCLGQKNCTKSKNTPTFVQDPSSNFLKSPMNGELFVIKSSQSLSFLKVKICLISHEDKMCYEHKFQKHFLSFKRCLTSLIILCYYVAILSNFCFKSLFQK